jgi:hypothetical protein
VEAFRAAKARVSIDVAGKVRIYHEFHDENLDSWEDRYTYYVHPGTKSMKEAA